MTLYVDDKAGLRRFRTQSGHYALCGEGLCIGYDSGDPGRRSTTAEFPFTGGRDHQSRIRRRATTPTSMWNGSSRRSWRGTEDLAAAEVCSHALACLGSSHPRSLARSSSSRERMRKL